MKSRRFGPLILVAAGLLTQSVYLVYVLLFPLTRYGLLSMPLDMEKIARTQHWMGWVWLAGLLIVYASFGLALWVVDGSLGTRFLGLLFGLVFAVTLVWLYPVTAIDLFQYVLRARVWVIHLANPLLVAPGQFPADAMLAFAGEWQEVASPYGPVWELLAGGVVWAGLADVVSGGLAFKVVALASYLAVIGILAWGLRGVMSRERATRAVLFFAWNPLVLLQGVGNGHNDMFMLVWMLLAVVIWRRRPFRGWAANWLVAGVCICLAVLTKAVAGLMAVLLVIDILRDQPNKRRRVLVLVGFLILAGLLSLLVYAWFWPPWSCLAGVLDEMTQRFTYTIAATVRMALREWVMSADMARVVARLCGQLLFVAAFAWTGWRLWLRRLNLVSAAFVAYFAFLMCGTSYRIWYPLWLVPLAALSLTPSIGWRVGLLCFTSELSLAVYYYVWRWFWPGASWLQAHLRIVPWQFGLPLLGPIPFRRRLKRS